MKIYGVDFTSRPCLKKPIVAAECRLEATAAAAASPHVPAAPTLRVDRVISITTFEQLSALLRGPGPFVAAMDLPLGQPRQLVQALRWMEAAAELVGPQQQAATANPAGVRLSNGAAEAAGDSHVLPAEGTCTTGDDDTAAPCASSASSSSARAPTAAAAAALTTPQPTRPVTHDVAGATATAAAATSPLQPHAPAIAPLAATSLALGASEWDLMVEHVRRLPLTEFKRQLEDFMAGQPPGQKHLKRRVAALTQETSPMSLVRTPTAQMFFAGAPLLADSPCCVLPHRPNGDGRVVVEAYPALVARRCIGRRTSYKSGSGGRDEKDGARRAARQAVVKALLRGDLGKEFGVVVEMPPALRRRCVEDGTGDALDAVLAALQAAWAATQGGFGARATAGEEGGGGSGSYGYGVPVGCDAVEGWVVDPGVTWERLLEVEAAAGANRPVAGAGGR